MKVAKLNYIKEKYVSFVFIKVYIITKNLLWYD